jgi:preprotein translocase subunit SecB
MKPSLLHIEGYHLKELNIELNESFAKKSVFGAWSGYHYHPDETYKVDPVNFTVGAEMAKKSNDPFALRYVLKIVSTGRKDKVPYSFKVSLVGYFHIDKAVGEKDERGANVLLYANAPALLYAAARELLATATARGPYPAVILPSVSFLDDAERTVDAAAAEPKAIKGKVIKVAKKGGKKSSSRNRARK